MKAITINGQSKCAICGAPARGGVNTNIHAASYSPSQFEARCLEHMGEITVDLSDETKKHISTLEEENAALRATGLALYNVVRKLFCDLDPRAYGESIKQPETHTILHDATVCFKQYGVFLYDEDGNPINREAHP